MTLFNIAINRSLKATIFCYIMLIFCCGLQQLLRSVLFYIKRQFCFVRGAFKNNETVFAKNA